MLPNRDRLSRATLSVGALLFTGLAACPVAHGAPRPQTIVQEFTLDTMPVDLTFSPDGTHLIVRGTDDGCESLTIYDVSVSPPTKSVICRDVCVSDLSLCNPMTQACALTLPPNSFFGDPCYASDVVVANNYITFTVGSNMPGGACVSCIGAGAHGASDVSSSINSVLFAGSAVGPAYSQLFSSCSTPPPPQSIHTPSVAWEGQAADIAMTPDGSKVLVFHGTYLDVYKTDRAATHLGYLTLLSSTAGTSPAPDFVESADTLAVSKTRTAILTTQCAGNVAGSCFAIVDTSISPIAFLAGPVPFYSPTEWIPPHDIAMTPSGSKVIATGGAGWFGPQGDGFVAIYNAVSGAQLGFRVESTATTGAPMQRARQYATPSIINGMRDSVEATETRAIVIGDVFVGGRFRAQVDIYDLTNLPIPPSPLVPAWSATAPDDLQNDNDRAVDLAISPDGTWAVVKTQLHNVVITKLDSAPPAQPVVTWFASLGDPYNDVIQPPQTMLSDVVEMTNEWAVTIGAQTHLGMPRGVVDFIHLVGSPATVSTMFIEYVMSPDSPQLKVIPVDLKFKTDGSRVVVRSHGPQPAIGTTQLATQIVIFDLGTGTPVLASRHFVPGRFWTWARDWLEVGVNMGATISQNQENPADSGPFGFPEGCGWVHIFNF